MTSRDYYDILGISKNASEEEIKKAYRRLAREHHPDVAKDKKVAEEKFKEINEAYQVLSDSKKRQAYDQFGKAAFQQGAGFQGGPFGGRTQAGQWGPFTYTYTTQARPDFSDFADFGDPFDIFEQVFGFRGFGGQRQPRKGRNLYYQMEIDFMDSVKGLTREISINGRKLKVKIPAGIRDGSEIRFEKEGERPKDLVPGDLFLTIRVHPHHKFIRQNDDIFSIEKISFVQAILGDVIQVDTVNGKVKLKIPSGTQPGTQFRIHSKGMPHLRRSGRGDHYVRVLVEIPKRITREQKKMLEKWE